MKSVAAARQQFLKQHNRTTLNLVDPFDTPIALTIGGPPVLACGAWLKNTVCVTQGNTVHISPLIGDLATAEARDQFDQTVQRMCRDYAIQPAIVTHDLHPDFYSTQFAQAYAEQQQIPLLAVQHHHAHIAAVCAEHQLTGPVLGLASDGVGLGTDNAPWGGELLLVDGARFERLGHLTPLALPGGDRAAQEPWRMAAAALTRLDRGTEITRYFPDQPAAATVATMLARNLNCPQTSSMGRLFDAAAGLLGICAIQSHEAQAAIQLQQLAEQHGEIAALAEGYRINTDNHLDFSPLLAAMIDFHDAKHDVAHAAALFHATLITGLTEWLERSAKQHDISQLALGGGCFHNAVLRHGLMRRLTAANCTVFAGQRLLPDDSAIALGQAWVALHHNPL
ncbi:MAG: carbamoyltransferase HypF [Gammaproteobacteria bacterium]|nr:MAG: carbamoyltransferase HypF [Gammaproteobacteria bacterium]